MSNTIGKLFKISVFGESHGKCIGVVVDCGIAGQKISEKDIQKELDRRRPGQSKISTTRKEEDKVEILSGIFNGFSTGTPICLLIRNKDVDSSAYEKMKDIMRPGHADFTSLMKYGKFHDHRGGGQFSGRMTAGFVMAGVIAKKLIAKLNIKVLAHTIEIGGIKAKEMSLKEIETNTEKSIVRCADLDAAKKMVSEIEKIRKEGDSLGGIIEAVVTNVPVGLGEPFFDTLEGDLSKALFAIPAVKGVEFGSGFAGSRKKGSKNNDSFIIKNGKVMTKTNNAGGILGGISNGMPIILRVAIKPTPSISKSQKTVDVKKMKNTELKISGRHDPCVVPRAVPIVESCIACILADHSIRSGKIQNIIS
jgi:chorismate synthase